MKSIVFASCYHRRSIFFEEGLQLLLDSGYKVTLQDTGGNNGFGEFGINHENNEIIKSEHLCNYDACFVNFKDILKDKVWDVVIFIDNDLFFTNILYLKRQISDFIEGGFDYCSHFINEQMMRSDYKFNGKTIAEVRDQKFERSEQYPYTVPAPHWENCFMFINRRLYNKLTPEDLSHGRLFIKAIHDLNAKVGVRRCDYKLQYSHHGDGWFHIGNLMKYYYILESEAFDKLDPDSVLDKSRIGYFEAQRQVYGDSIYSDRVNNNLNMASNVLGGDQTTLNAWNNLINRTAIQKYKVYQ